MQKLYVKNAVLYYIKYKVFNDKLFVCFLICKLLLSLFIHKQMILSYFKEMGQVEDHDETSRKLEF